MDSPLGKRPARPLQPDYRPPGLLTLFEAYLAVGEFHYGDDWTGHEIGAPDSSTVNARRLKLEHSLAAARQSLAALDNSDSRSARLARDRARRLEVPSDHYIETLKKPDRDTIASAERALSIIPDADDAAFERHRATWKYLRDLLCTRLRVGVMSTELGRPTLDPNANPPDFYGMPSPPRDVWWLDEADAILESGKTVAVKAGKSQQGWVMVREVDLATLLAGENESEAPSKAPGEDQGIGADLQDAKGGLKTGQTDSEGNGRREQNKADTRKRHDIWVELAKQKCAELRGKNDADPNNISRIARLIIKPAAWRGSDQTIRKVLNARKAEWM